MWVKQRNAVCETLLEKWVEPFSVFPGYLPQSYPGCAAKIPNLKHPAPLIRQVWRMLMENHPHDSICGCSIDPVLHEMGTRFDQVEQIGEELTRQTFNGWPARSIPNPGALSAVVMFNPSSSNRRDLVEIDLSSPEEIPGFELVTADGSVFLMRWWRALPGNLPISSIDKKGLRDLFGNIHEGRVAGMAILQIHVGQPSPIVSIDAVVSEHDQPDLIAWKQAEQTISPWKQILRSSIFTSGRACRVLQGSAL